MESPALPDFPMQGMSRDALIMFRRHLKGLLVMVDNLIVQKDLDTRQKRVYEPVK